MNSNSGPPPAPPGTHPSSHLPFLLTSGFKEKSTLPSMSSTWQLCPVPKPETAKGFCVLFWFISKFKNLLSGFSATKFPESILWGLWSWPVAELCWVNAVWEWRQASFTSHPALQMLGRDAVFLMDKPRFVSISSRPREAGFCSENMLGMFQTEKPCTVSSWLTNEFRPKGAFTSPVCL